MSKKYTETDLFNKYQLDFHNYSDAELRARNKKDIEAAIKDQMFKENSISYAGRTFGYDLVNTKQNWVTIRQNEELIRRSERIIIQNEEIISQNKQILYLLNKDSAD
ncbi:MAG: hypothetical protein FWC99_01695 [Coriobacteriia bacterium]|nr:hypothetical protein [Coriobacteriia bacterium]